MGDSDSDGSSVYSDFDGANPDELDGGEELSDQDTSEGHSESDDSNESEIGTDHTGEISTDDTSEIDKEQRLKRHAVRKDVLEETAHTESGGDESEMSSNYDSDDDEDGSRYALQNDFDYFDSSDEEDVRNTIGNIPLRWYDDYDHVGYNWSGEAVTKPEQKSEIESFMSRMDDPNFWRTVRDRQTGAEMILDDDDVGVVSNIESSRFPEIGYNPYQPFVDFFTNEVMQHPVTNQPEHKRSFIPSKIEKQMVSKMVHAIKMGWIKPRQRKKKESSVPIFYDMWANESNKDKLSKSQLDRLKMQIPAPKLKLPGHEESYNPPPEYILDKDETKAWEEADPETRRLDFLPQKYGTLRHVPAYATFIRERFQRLMDLYMAPRQRKMKLNVKPDDLLPKLPKPDELQPFPSLLALVYKGHKGIIRSVALEPHTGQFLASERILCLIKPFLDVTYRGCDDNTIKIWEVSSGRCVRTITLPKGSVCYSIAWCPNKNLTLLAAAVDRNIYLLNTRVGDKMVISETDNLLTSLDNQQRLLEQSSAAEAASSSTTSSQILWNVAEESDKSQGIYFVMKHPKNAIAEPKDGDYLHANYTVKQVTWHCKGDYFASALALESGSNSCCVYVHQLSKCKSQAPFSKSKGIVQQVMFHPTQPLFYVATQRFIRVYNLVKQQLVKRLMANCRHISTIALHSSGDHVLIGSYDCRVNWFDLDLSIKPYQTLRYHKEAIRSVDFHKSYPLFASCSDDGSVIVTHGKTYSDFQNPLIVPVKVLRGHAKKPNGLSVTDCRFHPTQPWLFTAGADGDIRLFV